jgi:hypothetical protein
MKKILALLFMVSALVAAAQPKKAPKMAPITTDGYYVGQKGDTVRGEVQTNPEDETDLYRQVFFKPKGGGKLMPVTTKKAKAFGYENRHFVRVTEGDEDVYVERLAEGRLNMFKRRFNGKVDGIPGIETQYYMQDTRAEGADAGLKEIQKISTKFYKRDLKNYMKDQPMIWSDLDKFTFNENAVVNAINEFNKYYVVTAD